MAESIQIKGQAETHRSLQGLNGDLRDLSPLHREIAEILARAIASTAPRDTGQLADSFSGDATPSRAKAASSLPYAGVQNYGNDAHNITGRHYGERALKAAESAVRAKYDTGIGDLCRKAES